jgi:predicted SAM-dependent methyltransferase
VRLLRQRRGLRPVKRAPDGRALLHIWREGTVYEAQKGLAFHEEWTTVQFSRLPVTHRRGMIVHDLRRPLPFTNDTFDAVYTNHVLEHLTLSEGGGFVRDVRRVLKPGALWRISIPDLERLARAYIHGLETWLASPSRGNLARYEFSALELFDQMVRDSSGGLLLEYLKAGRFDAAYVRERTGDVFDDFLAPQWREPTLIEKIRSRTARELATEARRRAKLVVWRGDPRKTREAAKWMYDRVSLPLLLEREGFLDVALKTFRDSDIEGWERYDFDRSSRGDYPLEPSLYVEGRKPPIGSA